MGDGYRIDAARTTWAAGPRRRPGWSITTPSGRALAHRRRQFFMNWLYLGGALSITTESWASLRQHHASSCRSCNGGTRGEGALDVGRSCRGDRQPEVGGGSERPAFRGRWALGQVLAESLTRAPESTRPLLRAAGHHRGQALRPTLPVGGRGGGAVFLWNFRSDRRHRALGRVGRISIRHLRHAAYPGRHHRRAPARGFPAQASAGPRAGLPHHARRAGVQAQAGTDDPGNRR